MNHLEGYTGTVFTPPPLLFNDLIFTFVFVFFVLLAVLLHFRIKYFSHMLNFVPQCFEKKRQFISSRESFNLLDTPYFQFFTNMHTILLCGLFLLILGEKWDKLHVQHLSGALYLTGLFFVIILSFYIAKQGLYFIVGWTFFPRHIRKYWQTSYYSATGLFGFCMYFPLIWVALLPPSTTSIIVALLLFVIYRLMLFIRTVHIFSMQSDGSFFLCLYFCALEVIPLFLFCKGAVILYEYII